MAGCRPAANSPQINRKIYFHQAQSHQELLGLLAMPKPQTVSLTELESIPAKGKGWACGALDSHGNKVWVFAVSQKPSKKLWGREYSSAVQTPQKMDSIFECLINIHPNMAQKMGVGIKIYSSMGNELQLISTCRV